MKTFAKTALLSVALSSTAFAASAASDKTASVLKPTVVLVHGAFADGSTWNKVIPLLQAKGLNVVAVQNPLTSFEDDVATTQRTLALQTGPVVLVGHSYGGAVITEAGQNERVKALVYIAAFAPSEGQSVADLNSKYPLPLGFSHLSSDKEGFLTLTSEGVEKYLAPDVPSNQARVIAVTQHPTQGASFATKVSIAAWKTKPSWYLLSENDLMLQPALQQEMAQKIGAHTINLAASHVPHLSHPAAVAEIIMHAVNDIITSK